jgi:rhomboid protease GluP
MLTRSILTGTAHKMIELYENLTQKEADLCSLVLNASYIPHRVKKRDTGFFIYVDEHNYNSARRALEQYFLENRMEPAFADTPVEADHGYAGVWIAAFLGAVHFYVQGSGMVREVWERFGASALRINDGELYRTITALMLHADSVHLVGNMAGMGIFGTAVSQVAGWGVGSLMILLAGASGNLLNAIMQQDAHLSIGASTAVFGAIGILSAYQFVRRRIKRGRRSRAWLPILGGIALLGLLGTGEHVDLGAHLFGFIAGIIVGIFYSVFRSNLKHDGAQWICALTAASLVIFSWTVGYLTG